MALDSSAAKKAPASPWFWVPTLYLFEGIPNSLIEKIAPVFFADLGIDEKTALPLLATAALPWALKPFWSPLVDLYGTKRGWIWIFQLCTAIAAGALAFSVFGGALPAMLAGVLLATAFFSATHDIAADGFYLHGLDERAQISFVGARSTFFRFAQVIVPAALIGIAGVLIKRHAVATPAAWASVICVLPALLAAFAFYHKKILPRPASDVPAATPARAVLREFLKTWRSFFSKPGIVTFLAFFFFFRLSEVNVLKMAPFFLKGAHAAGGLGLDNENYSLVYTTFGTGALIAGGILGGIWIARSGLQRAVWPMVFAMHLPNLAFVALAHWQPAQLAWIASGVVVEQFGYGIGYTVFSVAMLRIADGPSRAAHFAFAAGLAYLGSLLPGYWVGDLQRALGYENFFWQAMACALPGIFVTWLLLKKLPSPE